MLKRDITYTDFDGNTVTETFYFNLTKTELIQVEVGYTDGVEAMLKRIIATNDGKQLIEEFQKIILLAYGEKSPDGKRFIKNDELRESFKQTAAYDALFMELATNDSAAADFVKGVMPADLVDEAEKAVNLPPPNIRPAETLRPPTVTNEVPSEGI